jgi:arginine deiminase
MKPRFVAKAEWDKLENVLVHVPDVEIYYGLLHSKANLYQGPFSRKGAVSEAKNYHDVLRKEGINVITLEDALRNNMNKTLKAAYETLDFYSMSERGYNHKAKDLEALDPEDVIRILYLQPTVIVEKSDNVNSNHRVKKYEVEPLTNLVYLRDQQITTDKGIVIGSLSTYQRSKEEIITKLAFECLGVEPVYEVAASWNDESTTNSNAFEGGDFIPAGDFALIGNGIRSTRSATEQILKANALGFEEIGVVHGWPSNMDSMHLDTWFNIAGQGLAVAREDFLKIAKVDLYKRNETGYVKAETLPFYDYLVKNKQFNYIALDKQEQENFGTNFLTLKDKKIIAVNSNPAYARKLQKSVDAIILDFNNFTKMYGGPHCGSCAGRA